MKVFRDYDENCPLSIEAYAQGLKGHTFHDVINWFFESYETGRKDASNAIELFGNNYRQGGLGNLLEQFYFGYDINNDSSADFKFAGVELKVTPYEIKKEMYCNCSMMMGNRIAVKRLRKYWKVFQKIFLRFLLITR